MMAAALETSAMDGLREADSRRGIWRVWCQYAVHVDVVGVAHQGDGRDQGAAEVALDGFVGDVEDSLDSVRSSIPSCAAHVGNVE
jgi:hypothetical protein